MQGAHDLDALKRAYERALIAYDGVTAALNRHVLNGTRPSHEELANERRARAELDAARRSYLDAWLLP
jgi:hypothetical protein